MFLQKLKFALNLKRPHQILSDIFQSFSQDEGHDSFDCRENEDDRSLTADGFLRHDSEWEAVPDMEDVTISSHCYNRPEFMIFACHGKLQLPSLFSVMNCIQ